MKLVVFLMFCAVNILSMKLVQPMDKAVVDNSLYAKPMDKGMYKPINKMPYKPIDKRMYKPIDKRVDIITNPIAVKALRAHNLLRNIHGVEGVKLDEDLSKGAESYARALAESEGPCRIELDTSPHARLGGIDENIAMSCSDVMDYEMSPSEAVAKWYEEACDKKYNFSKTLEKNGPEKFDHFRKIIWKKNRLLGIGVAKRYCLSSGRATCTIMVARYRDVSDVSSAEDNIQRGKYDVGNCEIYHEELLSVRSFDNEIFGSIEINDASKRKPWWKHIGYNFNEMRI